MLKKFQYLVTEDARGKILFFLSFNSRANLFIFLKSHMNRGGKPNY